MTDIAELALKVDATDVKQANVQLDKLAKSSANTERQVKQFSENSNKSLAFLKTGIAGVATAFAAVGGAQIVRGLTNSALAMERFTNSLTAATGSSQGAAREMAFIREESNRLGLNLESTASQFSKLTAAARGTALEGQAARDIFTAISEASTVLGLSAEQTGGALTAIEQIISKGTVSAEELRGQLGERLPGAFQIAARAMNVTTQELDQMLRNGELLAEDLLPALSTELRNTFGDQVETAASGLNAQLQRMETGFFDLKAAISDAGVSEFFRDAAGTAASFFTTFSSAIKSATTDMSTFGTALSESDAKLKILTDKAKMQEWGDTVARTAAFAVDGIRSVGIVFDVAGKAIGATIARIESLLKGDFAGSKTIGKSFTEDFNEALASMGKMQDAVEEQILIRDSLVTATNRTTSALNDNNDALDENADSSGKATKGLSEAEKEMQKMRREVERLTLQFSPLDRMNAELAELIRLRDEFGLRDDIFDLAAADIVNTYIGSLDEAGEKTKEVKDITDELGDTGRETFESISQFAIQGARDIQNALSNALLDGINGFKSFADSVLDIIKRLAANIASVKILEGLGVGSLFGLGSSSAFASGGGGGFSLSNLGSGALDFINSGFGTSNLFNSFATSSAGQSLGLSVTGPVADFGQLTNLGSQLSSLSTALAGFGIGTGLGSLVGGNKEVAGLNSTITSMIGAAIGGPLGGLIGGGINALFGRGPLKQKDSLIRGTITEEGIGEDFLTATNFKAKGGLLRGDKVDRVIINANTGELVNGAPGLPESGISKELLPFAGEAAEQAIQIGQLFDQAIKGFDSSLRQTGETLGIGSSQLDNFQRWIQLTATSAEGVTETQVAEEIQNIGDHMANVLLPGLQNMRKEGETATQALSRMVGETLALENALIVFGVSAEDAQEAIKGLSIAARTDLVDAAGGLDSFNKQIGFFTSNFLTLEEQVKIMFDSLDAEMQKVGLSANISREEFAELVKSVTQVGGASTETVATLLRIAPAFDAYINAQEQLEAQTIETTSSTDTLKSSVQDLGETAEEAAARISATVQQSFADIDSLRENVASAIGDLAIAQARERVNQEQVNLNNASANLAEAKRDLEVAKNAAQQSSIDAINESIAQRNELIGTYEQEASALESVVDRFGALSKKILEFKDSLALGNLSPFSPGEQLAIARQQFNQTRNLAAQGDEDALTRLPEVSKSFLEASKTFNGATGAFESDFSFVQQVLESSGATAIATRDIAKSQLDGIEDTISELKGLNEAEERNLEKFTSINTGVMSVAEATQNLARKQAEFNGVKYNYDTATDKLDEAIRNNGGSITEVEKATDRVDKSIGALAEAVLQGFGNAFIADQAIRDYVIANPNLTDQQYLQAAVDNNISGKQLERALVGHIPGVTSERINQAAQGASVRGEDINNAVNSLLATGDFMGIYNLAKANGVSSQRLADNSVLSKAEIDNFVRANDLQPFRTGTDFVRRDGIAMLHKGEAVVPSSTTQEIKALRQELSQLRREQNAQMSALINTNIQANKENAQTIAKSNERLAANSNWQQRSRPKVA